MLRKINHVNDWRLHAAPTRQPEKKAFRVALIQLDSTVICFEGLAIPRFIDERNRRKLNKIIKSK